MEFLLHSTVRARKTRALRYAGPASPRRTQHILDTQRRLIPGRPVAISEEELKRNLDVLQQLEADGICEVRKPTGEYVNLKNLEAVPNPPDLARAVLTPDRGAQFDLLVGRTFAKTDISIEVAANPLAPVEILSKEPIPALVAPPSYEGKVTPAYPAFGPIPKAAVEAAVSGDPPPVPADPVANTPSEDELAAAFGGSPSEDSVEGEEINTVPIEEREEVEQSEVPKNKKKGRRA